MRSGYVFLIMILLVTNVNLIKAEGEEYQKINVTITDIEISKKEGYPENETLSIFIFNTAVRINNPNNESLKLTLTAPNQLYATNLTAKLDDSKINWHLNSLNIGLFQMIVHMYIDVGVTEVVSESHLYVEKGGLEYPPNGRYVFWIFLTSFGETLLNSTRTLMIIENGVPSFNFNYNTLEISANSFQSFFSLAILVILVNSSQLKKRIKK
ncbi:MAG: hypothetical protein ACFFDW_16335 [Candidatus Thorarchaeota archaeon]